MRGQYAFLMLLILIAMAAVSLFACAPLKAVRQDGEIESGQRQQLNDQCEAQHSDWCEPPKVTTDEK